MISKKICLLGAFAVGKTSLARRFVESCFDEKYQTTIGVKIDKKVVAVNDQEIQLIIWDMEGRDEFTELNVSYLRGASGYLLVADTTRPDSLEVVKELQRNVEESLGDVPYLLLVNKTDLADQMRISKEQLEPLYRDHWLIFEVSAKTGKNVETAFQTLSEKLLEPDKAVN